MKFTIIVLLLLGSGLFCSGASIKESPQVADLEDTIDIPNEILAEPQIQPRTGCSVNIDNLGITRPPLFLVPGTSTYWPFSDSGYLEASVGQTIELFCPTTYTYPSGKSGSQIATCVSGSTFQIGTTNYDLTLMVCTSWPATTARTTTTSCNGGTIVESGFAVGTRFVKQLEICFNIGQEVTRYVKYKLEPGSNYFQSNVARPSFATAGYFAGKNVDNLYSQATQLQTLDTSLGGVGANYINVGANIYLARGHLAAMADFVYADQQRGTFLFLNAAPQWQAFNAGNWERVEDNVRTWVTANALHVDVYTGTYGVTTLANNLGVQTPVYLAYDSNNNGLIAVPMLYFRVVIEPSTQRGVVFIGVNNPYLSLADIQASYILCPDVSSQITWLTWNQTKISIGYSYACEVPAFAAANPNLPAFNVTSLLY